MKVFPPLPLKNSLVFAVFQLSFAATVPHARQAAGKVEQL